MERSERAGIGRFVLRTKQYLAAIRAADDVLLLNTMYFADEIRDTKGLDVPKRVKVGARELKIADQLIESLTVDWDPERYDDTYRAEVMKVIRRKAKGQPIAVEAEEEPRAKVVDLVEALQASLDAKRKPRKRTAKKAAKRKAS
jgi:DNA end-binding protein Ku